MTNASHKRIQKQNFDLPSVLARSDEISSCYNNSALPRVGFNLKNEILIHWTFPENGWHKLNVDDSC